MGLIKKSRIGFWYLFLVLWNFLFSYSTMGDTISPNSPISAMIDQIWTELEKSSISPSSLPPEEARKKILSLAMVKIHSLVLTEPGEKQKVIKAFFKLNASNGENLSPLSPFEREIDQIILDLINSKIKRKRVFKEVLQDTIGGECRPEKMLKSFSPMEELLSSDQIVEKVKENHLETPPDILLTDLFQDLLISDNYKGWTVRGKGISKIMVWQKTRQRQDALAQVALEKTQVFAERINQGPLILSPKNFSFFSDLTEDEKREIRERAGAPDQEYGFKYVFYPNSLIDIEHYREQLKNKDLSPAKRQELLADVSPIEFYLVKKWVPAKKPPILTPGKENYLEKRKADLEQMYDNYRKGMTLFQIPEKWKESRDYLEKAVMKNHGESRAQLGTLLFFQNDEKLKEMGEAELRVAAESQGNPTAQLNLGIILMLKGQESMGEELLKKAADIHDHSDAQMELAKFYLVKDRKTDAMTYLKKVADAHNDEEAQLLLGQLFKEMNKKDESLIYFKKAGDQIYSEAKEFLDDSDQDFEGGEDEGAEEFREGMKLLEKALAINHLDSLLLAAKIYHYGNKYQEKDREKAKEYYLKALESDPSNTQAQIGMGDLYFEQRDFPVAEGYFKAAVENDPSGDAYNILGIMKYIKKDFQSAVEYYKKSDEKNNPFAPLNWGQIEELGGNKEKAKGLYQKSSERGEIVGTFYLACLLWKEERFIEANEIFEKIRPRFKTIEGYMIEDMKTLGGPGEDRLGEENLEILKKKMEETPPVT